MTRLRHDRGFQGFEQIAAGGQVVRQGHQRVGATGVDNDRGLRVVTALQQVVELAPRLLQTIGRAVGRQHVGGQFEHHHQRIGGLLRGLFHPLPTGPEQGQQGQQPGQPEGDPGQFAVAAIAATQQHGLERCGQNHLPAACAFLTVPQLPQQPAEQRQGQ